MDISKDTAQKMKYFGIYQIAGGVLGLGSTIVVAIRQENLSILWMFYLIATLLYCYSIYCGNLLLEKKQGGLLHSLINQWLQFVQIFLLGIGFKYVSGLCISFGFNAHTYDVLFNFDLSTWQIQFNSQAEELFIGVNLVALFGIIFLQRLRQGIVLRDAAAAST